jgi:general secretion pathway protein D
VQRSKIAIAVLILVAGAGIVWWVGLRDAVSYLPGAEQEAAAQSRRGGRSGPDANARAESRRAEPNAPREASSPGEPNQAKSAEPNQPAAGQAAGQEGKAEPNAPSQPGQPPESAVVGDPNNPLEAVNLKDVEMKNIIEKIAQWTGKTVIPHDDAMKLKITIYAPDKQPRNKALAKIYNALRMKGIIVEEAGDTIFLKPIAQAKLGTVPTVQADEPLAAFENKDQIVQKFFKLTTYSPASMAGLVQPLVGEYGFVSADESTRSLLVIDTVANLMRIEQIIREFDVPEAEQTISRVFEIKHGDPAEMVQLLRILLGVTELRSGGSGYGRPRDRGGPPRPPERPRQESGSGTAVSFVIGRTQGPVILIPETRRKWIIARASPEDIKQIEEWIKKLDVAEPVESQYEVVPLTYANADEVSRSVEESLREMPGMELMPSVIVQPAQGQVLVFGRPDLRDMVKKLIAEMDMPMGKFDTKDFELQHADSEQIKTNIDNLYGEGMDSFSRYGGYYPYRGYTRRSPSDVVKVISYSAVNKVTVIASPENMKKIEKQIAEWDVALDVKAVKPRIITLQNSDPVKMAELLTSLFSEEQDSTRSLFRLIFWDEMGGQRKKIVGPLYGQLTFEDVPGTKKIIVISKIPEAYDVVEQLIYELDRQEMAEVPTVVQLKYADSEDLAERLNAIFNEVGTVAPIRRTARGLGNYSMDQSSQAQSSPASSRNDGGGNAGGNAGEYTPPWSRGGARRTLDEEPISNVIGRVRFIPDPHSKSILVLAPPEFVGNIQDTINELDVPGMQVMVRATIVAVDHSALTSLGVQLATNPEAFGPLEENSLTALGALTSLATRGSAQVADTPLGAEGSGTIVGVTTQVYALIDFLVKHTNAKVLNEQTLWTEDNEEASFFKGDKVAFQTNFSVSDTGGRVTSNFEFQRVGMTLAVRPSITPEQNVDMIVNIILSQLTGESINGQPVRTEMETTTNMIVADTETLMLGGILFQKDSRIKRKLPLLGDLPLIGGLFQHNDVALSNSELIVFITPFVVNKAIGLSEAAKQRIDESKRRLEEIRQQLGETAEQLREKTEKER